MNTNLQFPGANVPGGAVMGQLITPNTPGGDTLPFSPTGAVPTATGSGWQMSLPPNFQVQALGTLATGTTTLNCGVANYFTLTAYGGSFTLALANAYVGQMIAVQITGAGSAAATWPSTMTWIGSGSAAAPTLTANTTLVFLIVTALGASPTYTGFYLTN